jgi:peptidoglycan/xylan/chitin deacetylase (PgdA/CDA1 family)
MSTNLPDLPPWQWDEPTWRAHVQRVRAGQRLVRAWPGGARVAVALSFDSDHETIPLRRGVTDPVALSIGEYGSRVAAGRILEVLDRYAAPATFFMPAVSAELHPQEARAYLAAGHEVGVHGWIHEDNVSLAEADERALVTRATETLERLLGQRPVGIRAPSWGFSHATAAIVAELGFAYDSSLMADDDCYELLVDGEPTGVIELPVSWIRDDAVYFSGDRTTVPPRAALEIWRDEFDAARQAGGLFQLTMHPHIIGHRSRLVVLTELMAHIAATGDAWFATHAQVVDHLRPELEVRAAGR